MSAPQTERSLAFGAGHLVPDQVPAAWGARLIVNQNGLVDLVPDRQSAFGSPSDKLALFDAINAAPWRKRLAAMLRDGEVLTGEGREVTVYEDDTVILRGNSNGSYGYFYIAGWLK